MKSGPKPIVYTPESLKEKLLQHLIKTDTCWLWTRSKTKGGYGKMLYHGKLDGIHRLMWIACFGPIPEGICVRHKCDVRNCGNPDHLELGTHKDNVRDCVERGRKPMGSKTASSTLREDLIPKVFQLKALGASESFIAELFGVTQATIGRAIRRESWFYVNIDAALVEAAQYTNARHVKFDPSCVNNILAQ